MDYKVCIITHTGEITHTIHFSGNDAQYADNQYRVNSLIHLDDSIRTIKMKLLYELHKGEHANRIQLRPSYEELYFYGYISENTTTLRLFNAIRSSGQPDDVAPTISRNLVSQIIEGHPFADKIMQKLPSNEEIPYEIFESMLSEKEIKLSVKTPLGISFEGGRRDATFETNPFFVERFRAHLMEHTNLHYFDDNLLLNYGTLADRTIYVCLADRIYESGTGDTAVADYITRYYFPGLYKSGVKSNETLAEKRAGLVKATQSLLTDTRTQYYQSINTFYDIAAELPRINYVSNGITAIKLRLKTATSQQTNLEMLFKNMHCTKEMPYIKYNPGNRRENLYRFYFERTTRTGRKIPYLSRAHIMRMSKETGRGQQITVYLEGAVMENHNILSNCYVHFENDGDVQLQLVFRSAVGEETVNNIVYTKILPYLEKIGRDLHQTGYTIPTYRGLRDVANTKVMDMTYISKTTATKIISWETVPCIYSICTLNEEIPGNPPVVRLKRVENFREMDAANILIAELYGQVQYGDLGLHDVANELVVRGLAENEEVAKQTVATFLSTINEIGGEILENPGFPIHTAMDDDENTIQLSVTGLTSIFYLDTISTYTDAILKMTQQYKPTHPLLAKLKKYCKKAAKFREVVPEIQPTAIRKTTTVDIPVNYQQLDEEEDFFAQFASDEEEEPAEEENVLEEPEIDKLIERLNANKPNPAHIWFDETDEPTVTDTPVPVQPSQQTQQLLFLDENADEDVDNNPEPEPTPENEEPRKTAPNISRREPNKPAHIFFGFDSDKEEETGGGPKKTVHNPPPAAPTKQVQFTDPETLLTDETIQEESDGDDGEDENDGDEDNRTSRKLPKFKPVNPFLKKLRKKDPVLFMTKPTGKYKAYSVSCQPTSRHPVILTKDELDKMDKSAYKHAIKYGSDPKNPNYFICPRFWCFLTNSAISEEDVKSGKCGTVIPKNVEDKDIPEGAYVYELNPNEQIPGFIEDARADGKCLPCCFKKKWDNKTQSDARKRCDAHMQVTDAQDDMEPEPNTEEQPKKRRGRAPSTKTVQYIYSLDTYPVPENRWGFLPIPVQLFMQIDYRPDLDPNNPALLQAGKPSYLRCGVEQPLHQSFLGCFADIYSNRQGLAKTLAVNEFRKKLISAIDLDAFVEAHNGSLLSVFSPKNAGTTKISKETYAKYKNSEFASTLDLSNKAMKQHFDDAILAYEQFIAYLSDTQTHIDHKYLWDFVCGDNRNIIPGGLNLVILEIKANDIIDRVEIVCPTNLYSRNQYDAAKDTVILLKHDEFYEPVYLYELKQTGINVERFMSANNLPNTVSDMLRRIEQATGKYCPGMPSLPKIYQFANPVSIKRILGALVKLAKIESQVVNYQGKTIGLMVQLHSEKEHGSVYFPCAPSARLKKLTTEFMDEETIPKDYEYTVNVLHKINKQTNLPCKPFWKIKEDGLVVGFLTETNQFVPIKPTEDIRMDGLQTYEGTDTFAADKTIATETKGDRKRVRMTKYIALESQFYHAFRNRIRILINQFANREIRNEIRKTAADNTVLYSTKIQLIENLIERLIKGYVAFVDIDKSILLDVAEINDCENGENDENTDNGNGYYCIMKNGALQLPKWHLISKYDNEKIYIGRMADEFIRNDRIKAIMFDTTRLNSKTADYSIREDEFILVQSALTRDYFAEMETTTNTTPYAKNVNYETANPSISVVYPNEKIPLSEQYNAPKEELAGVEQSCLIKVSKIVGNRKQVWTRIFPEDAREYVLRDNVKCTYQPIIRIVKLHMGETWSIADVKTRLSKAYEKLFEANSSNMLKIANIMREQGKREMFDRFVKDRANASPNAFQNIIISDNYHITDMDIWVIANEYNLPIIVFNPNGLKGFFPKQSEIDGQWIRMGGKKDDNYHFIRSKIGSFANRVYEYNLIVPEMNLSKTNEFVNMVIESERMDRMNTAGLNVALQRWT